MTAKETVARTSRCTPDACTPRCPDALARSREAEVDLARPGIGPARCHDLAARVELDPLRAVHVQVAEEARLPATEAVVRDRDRDRDIDPDHPRVHLELELSSCAAVAGEDRRP